MHYVACANTKNPLWCVLFLIFFFCTGQLQFLQHQMQQQQMAMGAAAPQGGAPQPHTASQPRSKRKRSLPQPLPKSWQTEITLRTTPTPPRPTPATQGREWSILCSLSASLWRLRTKKKKNFLCPFCVSFSSWQICMYWLSEVLENQNCVRHRGWGFFFRTGSPTPYT